MHLYGLAVVPAEEGEVGWREVRAQFGLDDEEGSRDDLAVHGQNLTLRSVVLFDEREGESVEHD